MAAFDRPVLLVTHDVEEARYAADRVAVIVDGRLHCSGDTAPVFDDPHDLASARVLGWRNLLPVKTQAERRIGGAWGSLELPAEVAPETAWRASGRIRAAAQPG